MKFLVFWLTLLALIGVVSMSAQAMTLAEIEAEACQRGKPCKPIMRTSHDIKVRCYPQKSGGEFCYYPCPVPVRGKPNVTTTVYVGAALGLERAAACEGTNRDDD